MQFTKALLSTAYFGPIQYFSKILAFQEIEIEIFENYPKQTYRNRCRILGANGTLDLTIPVKKGIEAKVLTKDIEIDYTTAWQLNHWRAIESAYNHSPYFEYYSDDFKSFFLNKYIKLIDFNTLIINKILDILEIEKKITISNDYIKNFDLPTNIIDYREIIHPKQSHERPDTQFIPVSYYQVFSSKFGFVENLSILDLLFNEGPDTEIVINKCLKPVN